MSTEVDRLFGMFHKASEIVHVEDEYRRKAAQITDVNSRTCGNCTHWMKTTCIPEKKYGQFKSMNSTGCAAFQLSKSSYDLSTRFAQELEEINARRLALRTECSTP